ncbi:F-box protein At2g26160-like [Ziziphus jujuba]|uniref:F-box protein At2g26160-like n=1 Tax=Ziziphus jujuba TaxID=326968 RepID=A0ABM3ISW3_ZIZJJ|nr:F-box protein At2g26160-like [Ziziphus jujuba]
MACLIPSISIWDSSSFTPQIPLPICHRKRRFSLGNHHLSSGAFNSKSCLVKIEDTLSGKFFSIRRVHEPRCPFPKDLSFLDFRMVKLGKSYGIDYLSYIYPVSGVTKVIRYPDTSSASSASANYAEENTSIFVIYDGGKLGYAKSGDRALTRVDVHDQVTDYHDIIVHKRKPYVVDKWGTISRINDSSLELTQVSPPPSSSIGLQLGGRKHLVESCGELYLVDRYFDPHDETRANHQGPNVPYRGRIIRYGIVNSVVVRRNIIRGKTIGFKVYKVENDWGNWVEVTNLGDRAFFLNDDIAFSVSASEFDGCRGNCIYFKDRNDSKLFSLGRKFSVFNFEDRSISANRWSKRVRYSNLHLNRKLWVLDCSNSSQGTA